jgi:hypothetical protein
MEIFINELSLDGQFGDQSAFETAIKEFVGIFSLISEQKRNTKLFKTKADIFINRRAIENEYFQQSFDNIKNKQLREAFKGIVFARLTPRDWENERVHQSQDIFISKVLNDFVADTTLAEVAERNLQNPEIQRLVVNFIGSKFKNQQFIEVYKNDDENPENLILIDCLESKHEIGKWLELEQDNILKDTTRFRKTSFVFRKSGKGTPIYEEINTGRYWYPDYYHKDNKFHFEVFDAQNTYLGEADLAGELIPGTRKGKEGRDGSLPI